MLPDTVVIEPPPEAVGSQNRSSKKPTERRVRRSNLREGECCCCVAVLPKDPGKAIDLERVLGIEGELPLQFFVCSRRCRNDFAPMHANLRPVLEIKKRISAALTTCLKTDIRPGDRVEAIGNLSAGVRVYAEAVTIQRLHYNAATSSVTLTVKGVSNGTIKVGLSGVRAAPDKENAVACRDRSPAFSHRRPPALPPAQSQSPELRWQLVAERLKVLQLEAAIASQQHRASAAERAVMMASEEAFEAAEKADAMEATAPVAARADADAWEAARREQQLDVQRDRSEEATAAKRKRALLAVAEEKRAAADARAEVKRPVTEAAEAATERTNAQLAEKCDLAKTRELRRSHADVNRDDAKQLALELDKAEAELKSRDEEIDRLRARVAELEKRDATIRVPCRPAGVGARDSQAWPPWVRHLCMRLLALRVAPSEVSEVIASIVIAVIGEERAAEMELPSLRFVRNLPSEMGRLHELLLALDLSEGEVRAFRSDASPLDGKELVGTQLGIDGDRGVRDWTVVGATELADLTARGESKAIVARDIQSTLDQFRGVYAKLHGSVDGISVIGDVGVRSLVGAVGTTDNAAAALASIRERRADVHAIKRQRRATAAAEGTDEGGSGGNPPPVVSTSTTTRL